AIRDQAYPMATSGFVSVIDRERLPAVTRGKFIIDQAMPGTLLSRYAAQFFEECASFWRIPPEEHRDWYWFNYVSPIWGPDIWEEPVGIGGTAERVCASIGAEAGRARLYIPIEAKLNNCELPGIFLFHHAAHAASSYYSSQQHEAVVVTHDGGTGLESGFVFH